MIENKIIFSKINKYFSKNKISILEMKKYLKLKGFNVTKKNKSNVETKNLNVLLRTFLSCLIIISTFIVLVTKEIIIMI